jgi:pilus assembly protein Flp/PilA
MLGKFLKDESGATALEYGLIGSLMALAIVGGSSLFATDISTMFNFMASEYSSAVVRD